MRPPHCRTVHTTTLSGRTQIVIAAKATRGTACSDRRITATVREELVSTMANLGLHEAAVRCGVSDETIRRRLKRGALPNAVSGTDGWQIPIADLIAAGLSPKSPRAVQSEAATAVAHHDRLRASASVEAAQREHIEILERTIATLERTIAALERTIEAMVRPPTAWNASERGQQ